MSGMPWSKLHTDKLHDIRILRLSDQARGDYFMLQMLAAELNSNGLFIENGEQLSERDIAIKMRMEEKRIKQTLKELKDAKLILANGHGPFIADWKNEQPNWREVQEQWRDRKNKSRASHSSVTSDTDTGHDTVTVKEEEKKTQTQIKKENLLLLLSEADRELVKTKHPGWISEAITIAMKQDKPRATYAAGIIRNWSKEGRNITNGTGTKANVRRDSGRTEPKQPAQTTATPSERAVAKRIADRIQSQRKNKAAVNV